MSRITGALGKKTLEMRSLANTICQSMSGSLGLTSSDESELFGLYKKHAKDLTLSQKALKTAAKTYRDHPDCWQQMMLKQLQKEKRK
jgi:hypothetical protein